MNCSTNFRLKTRTTRNSIQSAFLSATLAWVCRVAAVFGSEQEWLESYNNSLAAIDAGEGFVALDNLLETKRLAEDTFGFKHDNTARTYALTARAALMRGQYYTTITGADKAIHIWQELDGTNNLSNIHIDQMTETMELRAAAHFRMGSYTEAEQDYGRIQVIRLELHPDKLGLLGINQSQRAECQLQKRDLDAKQLSLARRGYEAVLKTRGLEHPDTGYCLGVLGESLRLSGATKQGIADLDRGIEIQKKALGKSHPALVDNLTRRAFVHAATNNMASASALFEHALGILKKHRYAHDLHMAGVLDLYGTAWLVNKRRDKAKQLHQQAYAIREKVFESDPAMLAPSAARMARVHASTGERWEAIRLYREALDNWERAGMSTSLEFTQACTHLGQMYEATGKLDRATSFTEKVITICERTTDSAFEKPHAHALTTRGVIAFKQRNHDAVVPALESAIALALKHEKFDCIR